jgi:Abortive infection C-terminus
MRSARPPTAQAGELTDDGLLTPIGTIDLSTGGRDTLDEQITRLRRGTDDPGALLGSAKDLLESTAKFVLEGVGMPADNKAKFDAIWHIARDRLNVLPQQVDTTLPGAAEIRTILQSSWRIAEQVNGLRSLQGAGHGRTLPTGVTPGMALLVVREACSVAEFIQV